MKDIIIWIVIWLGLMSFTTYAKSDECICKKQPVKTQIKTEIKKEAPKYKMSRLEFCEKQGVSKKFCEELKYHCDNTRNWMKCFWMWMSISFAETSYSFKHFWIQRDDNNPEWFAKRFNKYWYKAEDMSFFYWKDWKVGKSHYCTSEDSSWTNGWCPNWLRNATFMLNKYKTIFPN